MIADEKYCVDILTQINAVRGALKKTALNVLRSHTYGCVRKVIKDQEQQRKSEQDNEEVLEELIYLFDKFTE